MSAASDAAALVTKATAPKGAKPALTKAQLAAALGNTTYTTADPVLRADIVQQIRKLDVVVTDR